MVLIRWHGRSCGQKKKLQQKKLHLSVGGRPTLCGIIANEFTVLFEWWSYLDVGHAFHPLAWGLLPDGENTEGTMWLLNAVDEARAKAECGPMGRRWMVDGGPGPRAGTTLCYNQLFLQKSIR